MCPEVPDSLYARDLKRGALVLRDFFILNIEAGPDILLIENILFYQIIVKPGQRPGKIARISSALLGHINGLFLNCINHYSLQ